MEEQEEGRRVELLPPMNQSTEAHRENSSRDNSSEEKWLNIKDSYALHPYYSEYREVKRRRALDTAMLSNDFHYKGTKSAGQKLSDLWRHREEG